MKHKYRPGDVVRIAPENPFFAHLRNTTVTIKDRIYDKPFPCYAVEEHPGYVLDERCITGRATRKEKIVITADGRRTLARLFKGKDLIRTAEANRNPADDFDFATGARLAFSRLMPETEAQPPKPKYAPGDQLRIRAGTKVRHHIRPGSVITVVRSFADKTYEVTGLSNYRSICNLHQRVHEDDLYEL